jgi:regulator of protease activity HflC (stomatin/prohibitin superfamily)
MDPFSIILSVASGIILLFILFYTIRVCPEYERVVLFRLGRYVGLRGPGLYFLIPFIDFCRKVDLRTRTVDVEKQETITRDSVAIKINAVMWYKVIAPDKAILEVENYHQAAYQIILTSLRNIIGQKSMDEVLRDRDAINAKLREIVDQATDPWGIQVEIIDIKDVELPEGMQRAMAREAEASREKRARLIKAESEAEASKKLTESAEMISQHPIALELRRMQMLQEIGAEQNSTIVLAMPVEFIQLASELVQHYGQKNGHRPPKEPKQG